MVSPVNAAAQNAGKGTSLVSVRDTLVKQYHIAASRIAFNKGNGYVQVDGFDISSRSRSSTARPMTPRTRLKPLDKKNPSRSLTFVLVHGAWADSSYFNGVAAELHKMGYTVYTPEYAGHGPNAVKNVTHDKLRLPSWIISRRKTCMISFCSDIASAALSSRRSRNKFRIASNAWYSLPSRKTVKAWWTSSLRRYKICSAA